MKVITGYNTLYDQTWVSREVQWNIIHIQYSTQTDKIVLWEEMADCLLTPSVLDWTTVLRLSKTSSMTWMVGNVYQSWLSAEYVVQVLVDRFNAKIVDCTLDFPSCALCLCLPRSSFGCFDGCLLYLHILYLLFASSIICYSIHIFTAVLVRLGGYTRVL